jgi:hypothetical protein|nr:MAG TPA: Protein of unknown function (DUF1444) [Caudoviricetes sp.]
MKDIMSYEEFKEELVKRFASFLPEEFENCKVVIKECNKNNCVLDGVFVLTGNDIYPAMYANFIYDFYKACGDFDHVMTQASFIYAKALKDTPKIDEDVITDPEYVRKNVFMQLINYEKNKKMLENSPHVRFLDLAIIFRVLVSKNESGITSYLIKNELLEHMGFEVSDLEEIAERNTKNMFPVVTIDIDEIVDFPQDVMAEIFPKDGANWIVGTNSIHMNGAVFMAFKDELEKVADSMNSDFYIIPSSIHDVILVPDAGVSDTEMIKSTIADVNTTMLAAPDFLSDSLYKFTRSTGTVEEVVL